MTALNSRQLFWIIVGFILGSAILLITGILVSTASQDAWLSLIIGAFLGIIPLLLVTKLSCLYPGKSLVQYSQLILGKFAGKIVGIIWCWFALHLGVLVLRNFADFIMISMLPRTPEIVIYITFIIPVILVLFAGIGVFGNVVQIISPVVLSLFIMVTVIMMPQFDFGYLQPVLQQGIHNIIWGSMQVFAFPFGEMVLIASILPSLKDKEKCTQVLLKGLLVATILLLLGLFRTVLVLGVEDTQRLIYPVMEPAKIEIFGFIRGLEVIIIINWYSFGFIKFAVCLYAFCRGFSNLTGCHSYKPIIIPASIVMISLAIISFNNIAEQFNYALTFWPIFTIPIQLFIPAILLAVAKLKK
ncbi:GerAB/ArcD/ProY family transporter [Desulfofalx alkaliphila]|uniref:GerAB/ArcD/ProY family transporter n=1 Tax=Desulfofalx alkaliphila TaxID=105483 RepID=UPI0004E0C99B|nr:endospore germination permease [Desulfofalx alkaliphila]